ncbi:MAG: CoA transferase [Chloroflexi bacterium]|nr:CoA transferase [Chloroflexota bacterium]
MNKALEGVRVIDISYIVAGPSGGRTLAEYGAEVIKINNPVNVPDRTHWVEAGRGKLTMLVDLKKKAGLQIFYDLVQISDIVVENMRPDSARRLGVDYETVRKLKPDIIYSKVTAFGLEGPWAGHPGYEPQGQAVSGVMVRAGGRGNVPGNGPIPMNDYFTGLSCAEGALMALLERDRTGQGQLVDTALSFSATTIQSGFALDYPGFVRNEPEGTALKGQSALSRLYQCSDGWIALAAPKERDWLGLVSLSEFAALNHDARFATAEGRKLNDEALASALATALARMTVREALAKLSSAGVPAVRHTTHEEMYEDPVFVGAGLVVHREHEWMGVFQHVGLGAHLSETPAQLGDPAPLIGKDTARVLRDYLGYTSAQIQKLFVDGVVETHQVPHARNAQ